MTTENTVLPRINQVVIISDDPLSRHWMSQLIMRDWRTRVVASFETFESFQTCLKNRIMNKIDIIIVDADNIDFDIPLFLKVINTQKNGTKLIVIAKSLQPALIKLIKDPSIVGCLIKKEVELSLSWAASEAMKGHLVISKQIEAFLIMEQVKLDRDCIVFDGIEAAEFLTPSENRNAFLAFVLSMSRGNLADELSISPESSWTLISNLYRSMGVKDLLNGDDWIHFNINESKTIKSHLISESERKFKTNDRSAKETLAFHIYTKPKMHQFGKG